MYCVLFKTKITQRNYSYVFAAHKRFSFRRVLTGRKKYKNFLIRILSTVFRIRRVIVFTDEVFLLFFLPSLFPEDGTLRF